MKNTAPTIFVLMLVGVLCAGTRARAEDDAFLFDSAVEITSSRVFDLDPGVNKDSLFLLNTANGAGIGNYGPSLTFGAPGISARRAAIVSVQVGSDSDAVGLAFVAHPSSLSTAPMVEIMRLGPNGRVGIGTGSPSAMLEVAGDIRCSTGLDVGTTLTAAGIEIAGWTRTAGLNIVGGADLSEQFHVGGPAEKIVPGAVVCIDAARPGHLRLSSRPYDRTVAGILSGAGGVRVGLLLGQRDQPFNGERPVALSGRVYCLADDSNGPIEPGDLLTTSPTPGHAMKVLDHARAQGAILGKAMSPLAKGKGLVLALVALQ